MPENLYCLVKGCNNPDYNDLHICRKHFIKLPKDMRDDIRAMKKVCRIGEINPERFLFFVRSACRTLEPTIIIVEPKLVGGRITSPLQTRRGTGDPPLGKTF